MPPAADQDGGYIRRKDWGVSRKLLKRGPVTVVCEFMRDNHSINERFQGPWSFVTQRAFRLAQCGIQLRDSSDAGRDDVPLRAEPPGDVALRSLKPRVYQDVEARPAGWRCGCGWKGELDEPGGVGVEMDEDWSLVLAEELGPCFYVGHLD